MDHTKFLLWEFKIEQDEYHTHELLFEKYRDLYPEACMLCIEYCTQVELKYRQDKRNYNRSTISRLRYRKRLSELELTTINYDDPRQNAIYFWLSTLITKCESESFDFDKTLKNTESNYCYVTEIASSCEARGNPSKAHW